MISKFKPYPQRLLFSTTSLSSSPPTLPYFRTHQFSNDFISHLCKQKRFREAVDAFHSLQTQTPNAFTIFPCTYAHLFLACSHLRSLHHGRRIHRHLTLNGPQPDVILCNHILNMYGKCGSLADARQLFDAMPERNLVSWTSMISGYSQNCKEEEAVELYCRMLRSGLVPDQFCLGSVARSCAGLSDIELGRQLHGQVVKLDYGLDRIVQNALITMYSKSDRIGDAEKVFERVAEKDLVSWGSMISGFSQQGFELEALCLFKEMVGMGVHPNEFHFGSMFRACGGLSPLDIGEQLHALCVKFGLGSDAFAGCSLSDMYARFGRLELAKKAFCQISVPDLVSFNSIISALSHEGLIGDATSLFSEMKLFGIKPDGITIRCLLCACTGPASLFQGRMIHCNIVKMGLGMDIAVCNTLLSMYSKCSDFSTALDLFEQMQCNRDIVSWNTILTACLQHQQPEEVFWLSKAMLHSSEELDRITLNIMLCTCGELAYLEMGNQLHAHVVKVGLEDDQMVRNGLIDTYAKCGSLAYARKLFDLMGSNCDVFSGSSLIVGYAQMGYGEEALKLFTCMKELGIRPNHVTFVGVLTACSHVGLVDEGCHYYKIMEADYGITPTREHCSCVIDLLARAGRLREAERFMDQMPFEPDIVMWKTLLAACKIHNNVEIAVKAANGILRIDPSNSAAYVLLCNTFASSGRWNDVAMLRKSMRSTGVRKVPGKSWIKVSGEVRVFIVEDRSHPETEDIYLFLDFLVMEMMKAGYVSKTSRLAGKV